MYLVVSICEDPSWDKADHNPEAEALFEEKPDAVNYMNRIKGDGSWHMFTTLEIWDITLKNIVEETKTS